MQRIAMTPLAGIASGVERGLNAVNTMQDIQRKKQAIIMEDMKIKEAQAKEADLNRVTTKQILFDNLQMGENVRNPLSRSMECSLTKMGISLKRIRLK